MSIYVKNYDNQTSDDSIAKNPGKPITTYDIPEIVARAYPNDISKGFLKTGINSLDSEVFTGDDFKGCYVPKRPDRTVSTCFKLFLC